MGPVRGGRRRIQGRMKDFLEARGKVPRRVKDQEDCKSKEGKHETISEGGGLLSRGEE